MKCSKCGSLLSMFNKLLMVDQVILDSKGSRTLHNGLQVFLKPPAPGQNLSAGDLWFHEGSYYEWNGKWVCIWSPTMNLA